MWRAKHNTNLAQAVYDTFGKGAALPNPNHVAGLSCEVVAAGSK